VRFGSVWMYYTISRAFIGIPGIMYCTVFPRQYAATPPKTLHNADRTRPRLCNCLFLLPQTADCRVERHDHPIVHYIMVVECACEDRSVPNWKKNMSELTSQRFEVLEFRRKLHDDVLKSIFVHVALLCIGNFCIYPSIPTSQYICLRSHQLVGFLPARTFVAISNAHPYEDVKKMTRGRADMCDLCLQEPRSP